MRFKAKGVEVIISFSFFALILLSLTIKNGDIFKMSLLVSLLHECVHLLAILLFKAKISLIKLSVFGGEIKRAGVSLENYKEAVISLSAPVLNIVVGVLFTLIDNKGLWGSLNLLTGIFNIMPFYTFDGGRGLYYILKNKVSENTIKTICFILSLLVCFGLFTINGVLIKNNSGNILFLIMSLYLFILLIFKTISGY